MSVSKKEVEYVASLARITLSEEEKEIYTGQFNTILDYIHIINKLDLEEVEPTTHVLPINNIFRPDVAKTGARNLVEKVFEEAPEKEKDFFRVPSIIE